MTTATLRNSRDGFRQYVELIGELHRLMAAGRGDTPEADAVRDRMDPPWRYLDKAMIARVRGLSADLYSLEDEPRRTISAPATERSRLLIQQLNAARDGHDHETVLRLLREVSPHLLPELVAFLRGSTWLALGFPSIAALFFEYAWRVAPESRTYGWMWLNTLMEAGRLDEGVGVAERFLRNEENTHPKLIFKAVDVLFVQSRNMSQAAATLVYQRLSEVLEQHIEPGKLASA